MPLRRNARHRRGLFNNQIILAFVYDVYRQICGFLKRLQPFGHGYTERISLLQFGIAHKIAAVQLHRIGRVFNQSRRPCRKLLVHKLAKRLAVGYFKGENLFHFVGFEK